MKHTQQPGLHRFTRHEYARLIDHGFLDEDDPIELVDGLLLVKEPQSSPHRTAVLLVAKALERAFGDGWFVQTQSPITPGGRSEPEPDVCVIRGSPRDSRRASETPGTRRRGRAIGPRDRPTAEGRGQRAPESRTTGSSTSSIASRSASLAGEPGPALRHWSYPSIHTLDAGATIARSRRRPRASA